MQFIAIDRMNQHVTEEDLNPHLPAELAATMKLYFGEVIRHFYFRKDRPGVIFIIESDNIEEAQQTLNRLPLVKAGILDFEVIPIGPLMPLAGLFA